MDAQLRLLNPTASRNTPDKGPEVHRSAPSSRQSAWRLSADTRMIGRRGVAQARAALQSARHPNDDASRSAA